VFFKAALGRLFRAGRRVGGKLRHRAFALVPAASGTALGSPGRGFSRFPLAGEVWKPRRARAAADADAASLFPLARKKETRLSGCTGTPCPETAGNGSGRGDARSQPCLAASVTDAMPVEPSTRRFARTGTPNRTMGMNSRKMAGHCDCKMDVFRESPSCANGKAKGTGSWKVRTVFRRSDNGRPSETQPKFGSRFYEGLCLGRNYPGIAAFWNERRNRCRDATHPAVPKVMHRAMRKKSSPQA
jgi:hypothetical protein